MKVGVTELVLIQGHIKLWSRMFQEDVAYSNQNFLIQERDQWLDYMEPLIEAMKISNVVVQTDQTAYS